MSRLRKGDTVVMIAGADRGKTGRLLGLDRKNGRVLIEGVNMKWKHVQKSQDNPQGGRTRREYPVDISNVAYYDAESGKGVRLGAKGTGREKTRIMLPSGKAVES
jgi:large subunit ribosomal protein L24